MGKERERQIKWERRGEKRGDRPGGKKKVRGGERRKNHAWQRFHIFPGWKGHAHTHTPRSREGERVMVHFYGS